jgi:hypothetical protein
MKCTYVGRDMIPWLFNCTQNNKLNIGLSEEEKEEDLDHKT